MVGLRDGGAMFSWDVWMESWGKRMWETVLLPRNLPLEQEAWRVPLGRLLSSLRPGSDCPKKFGAAPPVGLNYLCPGKLPPRSHLETAWRADVEFFRQHLLGKMGCFPQAGQSMGGLKIHKEGSQFRFGFCLYHTRFPQVLPVFCGFFCRNQWLWADLSCIWSQFGRRNLSQIKLQDWYYIF